MSVLVKEVIEKLRLDIVYGEPELLEKEINTADITRPGLEMTGYFDYYTPERIQLLGMKEWSYLISMPSNSRYEVLKKMFLPETPAVIVARGLVVPEEMLKAARECKIAILTSRTATSRLSGELSSYLDSRLAERTSVHGVLMDIYGMGVLIQGDSGIGKSETGLELVKRGHRLVADDRVDIFAKDEITLWGEPAEILRHLIEIRGVGIIDVMSLYGASSRDSFLRTTVLDIFFTPFKFKIYSILHVKGIIVKKKCGLILIFSSIYKRVESAQQNILNGFVFYFSSKLSASASAIMVTSG